MGADGLDPDAFVEKWFRDIKVYDIFEGTGQVQRVVIAKRLMAGYDGHRGWLSYLATSPGNRREGIGRALVAEAESRLTALGCPKVQLMVRAGNEQVLGFYDALGYERVDVTVTGKRLIADA